MVENQNHYYFIKCIKNHSDCSKNNHTVLSNSFKIPSTHVRRHKRFYNCNYHSTNCPISKFHQYRFYDSRIRFRIEEINIIGPLIVIFFHKGLFQEQNQFAEVSNYFIHIWLDELLHIFLSFFQ